jgi:hypothetical protein
MFPVVVAPFGAGQGRRRPSRIAVQPLGDVVVVDLLAPQHPGQSLTLDIAGVVVQGRGLKRGVEFVGFGLALGEESVKIGKGRGVFALAETQTQGFCFARLQMQMIVGGRFAPGLGRVDRARLALDQIAVKGVFDKRGWIGNTEQPFPIALVFGEEQLRRVLGIEGVVAEGGVLGGDGLATVGLWAAGKLGLARHVPHRPVGIAPTPGVAKPEGGQQMARRALRPPVDHPDAYQNVVGIGFGVLDENVEVAVFGKDARLQ